LHTLTRSKPNAERNCAAGQQRQSKSFMRGWTNKQAQRVAQRHTTQTSLPISTSSSPQPSTKRQRSKYKNVKTTVNGVEYDSKKEARRARDLDFLQRAGKIAQLERQKPFVLLETLRYGGGTHKVKKYVADFVYVENGKTIVEDVKSEKTRKLPKYRTSIHLFLTKYIIGHEQEIEFREIV
jgi:hypothetical protein